MTEQNSELPAGWTTATLEELCDLNPRPTADTAPDAPVSFVPMSAVSDHTGEIAAPETRPFHEVRRGYTPFAEGDVLWAKITPCMENGKSAVARGLVNGLGFGSTEFFVLRSRGGVLPEYLHRFVRQERYRSAARRTMKSGVGQARVPKDFVLRSEVPVPPLQEQHRVVAALARIDRRARGAHTALEAIPELLEKFRQSVLAAAFRGDLTSGLRGVGGAGVVPDILREVEEARRVEWNARNGRKPYPEVESVDHGPFALPSGWSWASLEQLTSAVRSICYGVVQPGPDPEAGIPLVRVCDIEDGRVSPEHLRLIAPKVDQEYSRSRLCGGEVLVTVVGTIGRVAVAPDSFAGANIARAVARLAVLPPIEPEWVALALMTPWAQDSLTRESREVARKTLNVGSLARTLVPVAPPAERGQILQALKQSLLVASKQAQTFDFLCERLGHLERAVLAKAFHGELVPQDPVDEPASVLLERIRAERAANTNGRSHTARKPKSK